MLHCSWGGIDGLTSEVKKFDLMPHESSATIWFEGIFDDIPVFLGDMQEPAASRAPNVRWKSQTLEGIVMTIDWGPSEGTVTTQGATAVGYIELSETPSDRPQL
jgi:hypothetical protein